MKKREEGKKIASENYIYAKCRKAKRYAQRKLNSLFRRYSFKFINISLSIGKTVVVVIGSSRSKKKDEAKTEMQTKKWHRLKVFRMILS